MTNVIKTKAVRLSARQSSYLQGYTDPASLTYGNAYQSAISAGYSIQTARNFNHLKPGWLSENIGLMAATAISPEEIMTSLTNIIKDDSEPTILTMKAYNMLKQHNDDMPKALTINIDLTGGSD